jgi:hypothetical protein
MFISEIERQLKKPATLVELLGTQKNRKYPKTIFSDINGAITKPYYHELNPFFLEDFSSWSKFNPAKLITVRDGCIGLVNFLLKHPKLVQKNKFIIHQNLACWIGPEQSDRFMQWELVQTKAPDLNEAKAIYVLACLHRYYFNRPEDLLEKLAFLKEIDSECPVYLISLRSSFNIYSDQDESDSMFTLLKNLTKLVDPERIHQLEVSEFLLRGDFSCSVLVDVKYDDLYFADNFIHHFFLARGGSIWGLPIATERTGVCELNLSLYHKMLMNPVEGKGHFEMLKKLWRKSKHENIFKEQHFYHNILREVMETED